MACNHAEVLQERLIMFSALTSDVSVLGACKMNAKDILTQIRDSACSRPHCQGSDCSSLLMSLILQKNVYLERKHGKEAPQ